MKLNPRLLKEIRQSRFLFLISISLGMLVGICIILQARGISTLINQVFLRGKVLEDVSGILISVIIILFLRAGFIWMADLCSSAGSRRIKQDLRHRLFKHIIDLGPAYLRSEAGETEVRTGELVNVATEGVDALDVYYSQYLPQIALAVLIPGCILIFVFRADFLSGMILLLTAPLLPIFMYLISSAAETLTRKQWLGLSRMSAYFLDVLQGLTTLKSLGRSKDQVAVIKKVSEQYRQSTMDVLKVTFLSALVLELIATLSTAVVAVEVGIRLLYGKMAFEQAFFILLLAPEFYQPLRLLGSRFHAAMAGIEASKRLFAILDIPVTIDNSTSVNTDHHPLKEKQPPAIIIKDLSFTYSNNRPALQKVSFKIPAGKMTALVGESGSGKTTLTWLLLRFLLPQSGDILVNGIRLSEIPPQQWRDELAWVPQNPYLFNDSIAANIKLARPDASEADIQNAARLAHADDFISRLPDGYSTLIGERGARLSAGEAQRIALARAFLKDAPLLILDEPTSHLDPESDSLLKESLTRLSQGRTVLVIAHQQSTLSLADQVIKLRHGHLDEIKEFKPSTMLLSRGVQSISSRFTSPVHSGISGAKYGPEQLVTKLESTQPVLPRLIKLLSPFACRILLSIFLGFATIASGIGLMATSAYIISAAALHPSIAELQVAIVVVRFFGVSRGIFRYLERLVSHDVTFRLLARWRVWFFQALEPLAPARLLQYHSGDLLSRVIGDIGILEGFYVRAVAPPLVAILVLVVMGGFFSLFGSEFSWILLTFLVLAGLGLPALMNYLSHHLGPQMVEARTILSKTIIDGIQGLPDILTSSQPAYQIQRQDQDGNRLTRLQARMAGISAFQTASVILIANLCMVTILIVAIQSVAQGQIASVLLGVIALAALMSFEAVQPLPMAAQHLEANHAAARQLYELVDAEPIVNDPQVPVTLPIGNHLTVQDLSFQYPARIIEEPSTTFSDFGIENIFFSLPLGKHMAIIGRNGAGKTTLINLIQRYWEYQLGSIQLGGIDYHQLRQDEIRSRIATIPQNPYLFSATIRENLLIARPDASDDDIIQACQIVDLDAVIQSLPDGYNTWIGENGLRLSAGERQRLSIARALLKHAPLLILDEPTYNLDPTTEKSVMDSIKELSQGRSMVTITQHLVGLEAMDEIIVLKDGSIIEHGSHNELISMQGLYYQMWKLYNQIL